jgi:hypothetical protein
MERSKFKSFAREHQIYFREKYIEKEYNKYKTWLTLKSSINGNNFFDGFNIFTIAKQRYPIKSIEILSRDEINVFSDMLRSEHIPLNFFIPLRNDLGFCRNIFNEFLDNKIKVINKKAVIDCKENLKVEFAPFPKERYLNDNTSFDAYIEYTHDDGRLGLLGIEVKYTEKEYPLEKHSKQEKEINNPKSKYYEISNKSDLYKIKNNGYSNNPESNILKNDLFRQIWRNQLLAESILFHDEIKFSHSTSIVLYPNKNSHFSNVGEHYLSFLKERNNKFILITYEEFLLACYKHCPNDKEYKRWIDYLYMRYII